MIESTSMNKKRVIPSDDPAAAAPPGRHACYILRAPGGRMGGRTYNGYTNNMARRLKQHNKELVGGARATSRGGPWEIIAVVVARDEAAAVEAFTHVRALSFEWSVKYPTGHRPRPRQYDGPAGRIAGLMLALANPKFADLTLDAHVMRSLMPL